MIFSALRAAVVANNGQVPVGLVASMSSAMQDASSYLSGAPLEKIQTGLSKDAAPGFVMNEIVRNIGDLMSNAPSAGADKGPRVR